MGRFSRSRSRSMSPEEEGYRVHVADLGLDASKREIERQFSKFGSLLEVWVARNPPCFAFIVFKHREDAEDSIRELDGTTISGSRVRISFARPRTRGMRRRHGFDPNLRCYQCGERGHFSRDCEDIQRYRKKRSHSRSPRRRRTRSRSRDRKQRTSHRRSYSRERSRSHSRDKSASREKSVSREKSASTERKSRSRSRKDSRRSLTKSPSNSLAKSPEQSHASLSPGAGED